MIFEKISITFTKGLLAALLLFSCKYSSFEPTAELSEERILLIRSYKYLSEICTIKPDGSDLQIIISQDFRDESVSLAYREARWSPDKSHIVVTADNIKVMDVPPALWLLSNNGTALYQITSDGSGPHWSVDGKIILFSRGMTTSTSGYYTINLDNRFERLVLKEKSPFWWSYADWSADGRYLLTNEDSPSSDREIVRLDLNTRQKIQLTDNDVPDAGAQWSPDESKIVYASGGYTNGYQIKLMNNDGKGETTIADTVALYGAFTWSPDGEMIAFTKRKKLEGWAKYEEGSDIYIYDLIRSETKQITHFAVDSVNFHVLDWK